MEQNKESLVYSLVFNHTSHDEYANYDLCCDKTVHNCFQEPPSTAHDDHGRHRLHTYYSHEKVTFHFSTTIVARLSIYLLTGRDDICFQSMVINQAVILL